MSSGSPKNPISYSRVLKDYGGHFDLLIRNALALWSTPPLLPSTLNRGAGGFRYLGTMWIFEITVNGDNEPTLVNRLLWD